MTRTVMLAAIVSTLAAIVLHGAPPTPTTVGDRGRAAENPAIAASGLDVAVTWSSPAAGDDDDVFVAISHDAGVTFGTPIKLATGASINGEQPARVAFAGERRQPVAVWAAKTTGGTRLFTSRSSDGGRTFSRPAMVAGTAAPGNRGWQSLTVDESGRPLVVWLDHRDGAGGGGMHHHHEADAPASPERSVEKAASSRLYVGSLDGSLPPQGLTHGVCYCCKTAIASTGPRVFTAWRHVFAGSHRDIAFSMSSDGGRTFGPPVRISKDDWRIEGCPENGPALAIDRSQRVHVVWPTLVAEQGRSTLALFHASTGDGRTFTARTRVPAGDAAYHPQIVTAPDGSIVIAWDEGSAGTRRVRWTRGHPDRTGTIRFAAPAGGSSGVYPALAVSARGVLMAWTSRDTDTPRVLVAPIE